MIIKNIKIDFDYYFKHAPWALGGRVVMSLFSLVTIMIFARFASQDILGEYQLLLSIINIVAVVSLPGLNTAVFEAVAKGFEGVYRKAVLLSAQWSMLGIPILFAIGFWYYFHWQQHGLGAALIAGAFLFPVLFSTNTWTSFLPARSDFKHYNIYLIIQSALAMIFISTAVLLKFHLVLIFLTYLFVFSLTNLLFYWKTKRGVKNDSESPDWKSYGYFLTKMNIITTASSQVDSVIIATVLGPAALATYFVGGKLGNVINDFVKNTVYVVYPKIAHHNTLNWKKYLGLFVFSAVCSAVLIALVPIAAQLLFSSRYANGIIISQIIVGFIPIWLIHNLLDNHLVYYLKNRQINLYKNVMLSLVYLLALYPVLKVFGLVGLVVMVGLRDLGGVIILTVFLRRHIFLSGEKS